MTYSALKSIIFELIGRRYRVITLLMLISVSLAVSAQSTQKTMLIINSYSADAPWSQSLIEPINQRLNQVRDVHLEMVNLNSADIPDSTKYYRIEDQIFNLFSAKHPSYVIMVGNFAFTLRDRIKKEWGDIPLLLITRIDKYAPLYYYFSGYSGGHDWESLPNIADIRSNYNMTMIETPDFVNENIDLMVKILPNMKRLVFIGDKVYTNRSVDVRIRKYLKRKYPELSYEWLQENDSTNNVFQEYMLNKYPNTAFLINTWNNTSVQEESMSWISGNNLHLISSSVNPVFSLRSSFLSLGIFGGVFCDQDASSEALSYAIDRMLNGDNMRTLPLFICDDAVPIINHQRMKNLNLSEANFPENTQFIFRAPTMWEANRTEFIAASILLILLIGSGFIYMNIQRKRIKVLKTHASFVKQMPWAYSKAKVLYNKDGEIFDIEYDLEGMNSAFMTLLSNNLLPNMRWKMFPLKFIAEKTYSLIKTGEPVTFTYHFEKTDTYYEFLLCRINPEKLRNGELPKDIDIFANNITKRIQAESKLRTTMRTLDITLNVARIIPWQWDIQNGTIYYDGFRTLHNLKRNEEYKPITQKFSIDQDTFIRSVDTEDRQRICDLIEDFKTAKTNHKRTEFKVSFQGDGGRIDWVEINAAVTEYNHDGSPKTVLGSLLVITERKKQEEALIRAKEQASESDRMKSAFLANMSHEIRTPLNAIVGFSSLITQTDDREQKAKYSGIIAHNNDLLLHLINDVLDLAKIESNTLDLQIIDTDLNDLMRQIYETVRLRIAAGVVFNMVLGSDTCNLKTDPNRLMQVLINLLTNAAKFTQKGSITYGYEINDDEIEFFVRDTGIGISKENQSKLFHRFSKLNNFVQGTGLGLSICKSFIEKMGGEIWVKSRGEGKGTTFMFTIPYVKAEKVANLAITEEAVIETPLSDEKDITILIAEDNESNYILFDSILSKHYKLVHAVNGREAVELYKKHNPQLILMDIRMPEMDGYEATQEIRKMNQNVPIIAVTAHAFVTEKDKIMKSGFNGYVAKPINQKDLINSVKTQLGKRFFVF